MAASRSPEQDILSAFVVRNLDDGSSFKVADVASYLESCKINTFHNTALCVRAGRPFARARRSSRGERSGGQAVTVAVMGTRRLRDEGDQEYTVRRRRRAGCRALNRAPPPRADFASAAAAPAGVRV